MGSTALRSWRAGRSGARVPSSQRTKEFLVSARAHAERLLLPPSGVTEVLQSGKAKRPAVLRERLAFRFGRDLPSLMSERIRIRRGEDFRALGICGAVAPVARLVTFK